MSVGDAITAGEARQGLARRGQAWLGRQGMTGQGESWLDCSSHDELPAQTKKKGVETMLVLTRKIDERIVIDGPAELVVVSIKGDSVRLGFAAPSTTSIRRSEIIDEQDKQEGNR